ncbi:MAG: MarR family transcriptional regulator [Clostridiales bacterium 43-6]|uniref:HTH marR-type domain-containing protein n=1 Tax=bioreactor metagenome TaxID=1076179 RepID=A0A645JCZ3_9ZZZZ|nr:MAG: MarR family transcriptional regulator [Clostridiales bacterium 43-6]
MLERKLGVLEDGEMACCGISMAQCHALVEIGRAGSISLVDLATLLNLDNSTMSRTVNNLVNNSMVERQLDPNDRRYITIRLTQQGLEQFHGIESGMGEYFMKIYDAIPKESRSKVLESLQILLKAVADSDCCS